MASGAQFSTLLQRWERFDLPELHRQLEAAATDIASRQDDSDVSRKKLVEQSKEFKRVTTEEVRKTVAPLLKAFQSEVDALSKRSKMAETACLTFYRKMIDIPNCVPVLQQAVAMQQRLVAMQDTEIENKQLRETLQEYKTEFAEVKNQEVTINRLREQVKYYETSMQQKVAEMVRSREEALGKEHEEDRRQLLVTVETTRTKLLQAEGREQTLVAALGDAQSELLDLKNKFDEEAAAKTAEIDIIATDLERANQRLIAMEGEVEVPLRHHSSSGDIQRESSLVDMSAVAKEQEVSELTQRLLAVQEELAVTKQQSITQQQLLREQLDSNMTTLQTLESRLAEQSDYSELKRELAVVKSVEFSQGSPDPTGQPLEVLLLDKNKALQADCVAARQQLEQLEQRHSALQLEHTRLLQSHRDQEQLVSRLEADLLLASSSGNSVSGDAQELASMLQGTDSGTMDGGANEPMIAIVTGQRDRLKQHNTQLEQECQQLRQSNRSLQQDSATLHADNVKLFEKVKFLHTYPSRGAVIGDEVAERYSVHYEKKLDPFAVFSQKERQRKYMSLSGPDKATLILGRFILSNKVARMASLIYLVLLHLLVFVVVARLANTAYCSRDLSTELLEKFTEHMQLHHEGEGLQDIISIIRHNDHNLQPLPG